ncbi:hypothetical protein ACQ4PT_017965 [Festuca glaucescens]
MCRSDSSTEVQLGSTRVLACVSANLVVPHEDRPQEGKILIHTQFSAMADPSFETGVPEDYVLELNQALHKGIRKSKALDLENLCVVPGMRVWKYVWTSTFWIMEALCAFRRPDCTVGEDGKKVTVHDPEVRDPVPLIMHHLPIALTFAYSSDGNILVLDPTFKEEAVMGGKFTVFTNLGGESALGESQGDQSDVEATTIMYVKVDDGEKMVIGTLLADKFPLVQFNLCFEKGFELSHTSKTDSVFFCGYKFYQPSLKV